MKQEMVTIPKKDYEELKKKAESLDPDLIHVIKSIEDAKNGRIVKFDPDSLDD